MFLDCIGSSKKQTVYVANRLRPISATTEAKQWKHVPRSQNPDDHKILGLDPREVSAKWLKLRELYSSTKPVKYQFDPQKPVVLATISHDSPSVTKPTFDQIRFSSWMKLLLKLASNFILLVQVKKLRNNKQQYTNDYVDVSRKHLIRCSQENSFHSKVSSLKKASSPTLNVKCVH